MSVRLGQEPPDADIRSLLLECHERIRRFSGLACRLPCAGVLPPADIVDAVQRIQRYFRVALPLHVADEELTLLPRLKGRSDAVDRALETMAAEHRTHEAPLARLLDLCAALESEPTRLHPLRNELIEAAGLVASAFEQHLSFEERAIFPALDMVPDTERELMVLELRDRRRAPHPH